MKTHAPMKQTQKARGRGSTLARANAVAARARFLRNREIPPSASVRAFRLAAPFRSPASFIRLTSRLALSPSRRRRRRPQPPARASAGARAALTPVAISPLFTVDGSELARARGPIDRAAATRRPPTTTHGGRRRVAAAATPPTDASTSSVCADKETRARRHDLMRDVAKRRVRGGDGGDDDANANACSVATVTVLRVDARVPFGAGKKRGDGPPRPIAEDRARATVDVPSSILPLYRAEPQRRPNAVTPAFNPGKIQPPSTRRDAFATRPTRAAAAAAARGGTSAASSSALPPVDDLHIGGERAAAVEATERGAAATTTRAKNAIRYVLSHTGSHTTASAW